MFGAFSTGIAIPSPKIKTECDGRPGIVSSILVNAFRASNERCISCDNGGPLPPVGSRSIARLSWPRDRAAVRMCRRLGPPGNDRYRAARRLVSLRPHASPLAVRGVSDWRPAHASRSAQVLNAPHSTTGTVALHSTYRRPRPDPCPRATCALCLSPSASGSCGALLGLAIGGALSCPLAAWL
jgi:hypothetical protein